MASVVPVLQTQKLNASGTAPVYVRIIVGERIRYVSLGLRVRPKEWLKSKGRVSASHAYADAYNAIISERVSDAQREVLRLKVGRVEATAEDVKAALKPERRVSADFFAYADAITEQHDARGQHYLYKRYKSVFKKMRAFTGEPLAFENVTPELLRKYETHLRQHHGNNENTVVTNFNAVRAVFYRAIREGHAEQAANPFFQFKPAKAKRPERGKLTADELKAIEALELEPGTLLWHVRNHFLFSFYCAGVRFGDFASITHEQIVPEGPGADGHPSLRLSYRMSKTGTRKSIRLVPQARAILALYPRREGSPFAFPLLDRYDLTTERKRVSAIGAQNALINKYLKEIARRAGIGAHLSFHVSRHSFADIARTRGWSVYDISKALGHANLKVTETYLKGFDADALDAKMDELFGGPS